MPPPAKCLNTAGIAKFSPAERPAHLFLQRQNLPRLLGLDEALEFLNPARGLH
jgi:hypothetical protein